jgi:triacylglycerol esterase/lipase EstA (alpha/beta hydrolase family)
VFYSNGSGALTELALGTSGQALVAQGASSAPVFANITSVIAAGNWKIFYSNGSAAITELALTDAGKVLRAAGSASAPEFAVAETLLASSTVNLQAGDSKTDIYTVPASKKMIVTRVVIRNPSDSMAGGTDFDLGDGANADTWVNAVDLSGLGTAQYRVISGDNANFAVFDAADVFGIKPVTGATADVTATAELFGYLYNA